MIGQRRERQGPAWALAIALALAACHAAAQQSSIAVGAAIEKQDVFVGEPFVFQIQVNGSDSPETPDLSALTDFAVEDLGGHQNNSQSVSIVNGQMTQSVFRGFVFSYRLTAKRTGRLTVPAVAVRIGGQTYRTEPVAIRANEPQETDDFRLKATFEPATCYGGEPVTRSVVWYLAREARNVAFAVPPLQDKRLDVDNVEVSQDPGRSYFQIPLGDGSVIAEKGQARLDGKDYAALSFKKVLIPREAGSFSFPPVTVSCEGLVGYERQRNLMNDFFSNDFFGMGRQGVYRTFVTPSDPLRLEVRPLPEEGRPANFSGLIGRYRIEASAAPTDVNVGDPITLTVRVIGSEYLKHFELPPLDKDPDLARYFKIPSEMAPGKIEGDTKVFTQTLRAQDASVTEIPPISLAYFDSVKGQYAVAKSKPIRLKVQTTRVLGVDDVEGREAAPVRSQLTVWQEGIAHNYEDASVLENQTYGPGLWFRSPLWIALIFLPPVLFASLAANKTIRARRNADPEGRKARRAHAELTEAVDRLRVQAGHAADTVYPVLLEEVRTYLGRRLTRSPKGLTYRDVDDVLRKRGVGEEALQGLKKIFETCEAYQYAGRQTAENAGVLLDAVLDTARRIERECGR